MQNPLNVFFSMRKARRAQKAGEASCDYPPHRLVVETSSLCALRCPMCPTSLPVKFASGQMSLTLFRRIVDESASFVSDIELSHRGEPLRNRDLPEMIAYATERRIATHLSTNATGLSEELALRLIQCGLRSITFSVDGLEKEAYERIRIGANFEEVVENIENFLKMKWRLRSATPTTTIEAMHFPNAPVTEEKVRRFLDNFRGLPLDKFASKVPHRWAGCIPRDPAEEAVSNDTATYYGCPHIWSTMVILWDGSVALCPQDWYNDNPLGNIQDLTLEEMWNGWTLTFVRQLLANKEYGQIEVCSQCDLLWRPGGSVVAEGGDASFPTKRSALDSVRKHFRAP